ncbi:hypothetical protein T439DRAFT_355706 [Meredithblackwellia eburnea MCA 4105]
MRANSFSSLHLGALFLSFLVLSPSFASASHQVSSYSETLLAFSNGGFTLVNKCSKRVNPKFVNIACVYYPCASGQVTTATTHLYTGSQPGYLAPGAQIVKTVDDGWHGRIFDAASGNCSPLGQGCSMLEFTLDSAGITPQSYDISNIMGFTQKYQIQAISATPGTKCETVTCRSADCDCTQAYSFDNTAGTCGSATIDRPSRSCDGGPTKFKVTFCP